MELEIFKNLTSFVVEQHGDSFVCELENESGAIKTYEAENISGSIYCNDNLLGGFDDPVAFEIYVGTQINSITVDRADKDGSIYFEIYIGVKNV